MKKESVPLMVSDGKSVMVHTWTPETTRAVVVLSHGMNEYAKRYERFAAVLCAAGYALYAEDHRGHGETAGTEENLGFLAEKDGFQRVVLDVKEVIERAKADFPGKKVFLLGHSFGSFVAQSYIEQFGSEISGCILSGTAGPRIQLVTIAKTLALIIRSVYGSHHRSKFLNDLAFGSYGKRIENQKTKNDWLTRDDEEVSRYNADPFCNALPTAAFFHDLFSGLCQIHTKKSLRAIPVALPIFLFAGDGDPVGDYGVTVRALADEYRECEIRDVKLTIYDGGRHEMLNETNHAQVEQDILTWLEARS